MHVLALRALWRHPDEKEAILSIDIETSNVYTFLSLLDHRCFFVMFFFLITAGT